MKKFTVIKIQPSNDGKLHMTSLGSHKFAEAVGIAHIQIQYMINIYEEDNAAWDENPIEYFVTPIEFDEDVMYYTISLKSKLQSDKEFSTSIKIALIEELKFKVNKEVYNYEG